MDDATDEDEFERQRRLNSPDGYTGAGFGVNQNANLGSMRTPFDNSSAGSKLIAALSLIGALIAITLIVIFIR